MDKERDEVSNSSRNVSSYFFCLGLLLKDIKESKQVRVSEARVDFCAHFSFETLSLISSSSHDFMKEI